MKPALKNRTARVVACLVWSVVLACGLLPRGARAQGKEGEEMRDAGRVRAPELAGGRGWLNVDAPLQLAGLRGKVVLLDFWTYGCINCMHIIPDLQKLEAKYARQLVVVGVHSAKFDNEKETENIRRIILRYGIEHPVVNDADFKIWNNYAVDAWPTQVLIDPAGYVVGRVRGEGNYEALDKTIAEVVADFRKQGRLDEQPVRYALERAKVGDLPLAFPGKVLADERGARLFVSDSNHNRVVVARLDGTVLEVVGTGEAGARDGAFDRATFRRPQGLALDGETLYVADTENHLIRRVDLRARTVETIAGTGRQALGFAELRTGPALETALSSPWDLQLVGPETGAGESTGTRADAATDARADTSAGAGTSRGAETNAGAEAGRRFLYIAMAGPHQIWRYDFASRQVGPFAGTGREARYDASLDEAAFAQPSGLAYDGRTLYVADSESNIIRAVELKGGGEVRTLAGGDLFEFGDRDGRGDGVRLQHPLGLVFHAGRLFIADTYNHKIKRLDPQTGAVETYRGTGRPGQSDGTAPTFYEPGGLGVAAGRLYVADTNNHAVRVVDLKTGLTSTLMLRGLRPPASKEADEATNESARGTSPAGPNAEEIRVAPQRLRAGEASVVVDVALPEGYHLNDAAPQRLRATVEEGGERLALAGGKTGGSAKAGGDAQAAVIGAKEIRLPLRLPVRALAAGAGVLRVRFTLYYCREDNTGTCRVKTLDWRVPVEVAADRTAPDEIRLRAEVRP